MVVNLTRRYNATKKHYTAIQAMSELRRYPYEVTIDVGLMCLRESYRFNVGIACIKLARYQEAVDYVIKALRLQQAEALVSYKNSDSALKNGTSEGMWQTLRTAFSK